MRFFKRGRRQQVSQTEIASDAGAHPGDLQTLEQLKRHGVDLAQPRIVEHLMYVRTEDDARRLAQRLAELGYESAVDPAADNVSGWAVEASHAIVPSPGEITRARQELTTIAASVSGEYDGWGTPV